MKNKIPEFKSIYKILKCNDDEKMKICFINMKDHPYHFKNETEENEMEIPKKSSLRFQETRSMIKTNWNSKKWITNKWYYSIKELLQKPIPYTYAVTGIWIPALSINKDKVPGYGLSPYRFYTWKASVLTKLDDDRYNNSSYLFRY